MTQLLFREDPRATTFEATVTDVRDGRVALDRTLFYPEGGGQPSDVGALAWEGGAARVTDVQKKGEAEGRVWHVLDGAAPEVGATVRGEVEWRTRYRHMQRHTAEHLLAQAFARLNPAFGVQAVSMRGPQCTLDLAGGPTDADAREAERVLLDVVARNLAVEAFEVPEAGLADYPLRRPSQVGGTVRLVGVREEGGGWWEMVACGGTHLPSTAFAAPVVVLGTERVKGGLTRVTFMAGEEATEYLAGVYRDARGVAQSLSVPVERLPERVAALQTETLSLRAELGRAQESLARALVEAVPGGARLVRVPEAALVTPALKALAALPETVGAVVSPEGRCGVASSRADRHAGQLLGAWLAAAGGRGGGKPDVAQGQAGDPAAFEAAAREGLGLG